jgi:hypothetical protein
MIINKENQLVFPIVFSVRESFKSTKVFEIFKIGHFLCPKIEKGEILGKNTFKNCHSEHYGLSHRKNNAKFVMTNFLYILRN